MSKKNETIKLNLGAGFDHKPGYLNLDIDPRTKPDLIHDLRQPLPFKKNSVQEIILQDVLEHLTKEDAEVLLKRCSHILQRGGVLRIRVPNVFAIINKFRWQDDIIMLYLYGDTTKNGEWGAHKYGYTPNIMAKMVRPLGLAVTLAKTDDTNLIFELEKMSNDPLANPPTVKLKTWYEFLLTWWHRLQGEQVVWQISQPLPTIFSKAILRPMSLLAERVEVSNNKSARFAIEVLRFSSLRIVYSK